MGRSATHTDRLSCSQTFFLAMSCALFPCVAAAAAPGPASVASASDSLASDDFLTAGSASDSEPERVDPEPQIPSFGRPKIPRAAEVAASWCRQKRTLPADITFQPFVEGLMVCATRWRFTDECLEMILAGFSETAQLPAHDHAPSAFKLRKMMETRSSVALQQFPVCAKECSVYPKSFDQMTAEEINNARCLVCAGRFMNVSSKNPKPEKVSLFKHLFGCAKLCLVAQALFGCAKLCFAGQALFGYARLWGEEFETGSHRAFSFSFVGVFFFSRCFTTWAWSLVCATFSRIPATARCCACLRLRSRRRSATALGP